VKTHLSMKIKFYFRLLASAALAIALFSSISPTNALALPHSGPRDGAADRQTTRRPGDARKTTTCTRPPVKVGACETLTKDSNEGMAAKEVTVTKLDETVITTSTPTPSPKS
jgi:hypothetical protein